jgi:hypothetical protein
VRLGPVTTTKDGGSASARDPRRRNTSAGVAHNLLTGTTHR